MKLYVNGVEVSLEPTGFEIDRLSDRFVVKTDEGAATAVAIQAGDAVLISYGGHQYKVERTRPRVAGHGAEATGEMLATMPGLIVDVLVDLGSSVEKGDKILVLEAMKTQQSFVAPFSGTVIKLNVSKGQQVVDGALLATIKPDADKANEQEP